MNEMDEDCSLKQKQEYLTKEIIDKNFDPLEFEEFIKNKKIIKEINLNEFTDNEIKELIEEFTSNQQKEQNSQDNKNAQIQSNKEECEKEFKRITRQQLLGLSNQEKNAHQKILNIPDKKEISHLNIYKELIQQNLLNNKFRSISLEDMYFNVSNPEYKLVYGTHFIPKQCYYKITSCKIQSFQTEVIRSLQDFFWFEEKLNQSYPGIFVPPIPNSLNRPDHSEETILCLKNFLNAVSQREIFYCEPLFEDFVSLPLEQFNEKKKQYDSNSIQLIQINSDDTCQKLKEHCDPNIINVNKIEEQLRNKSNELNELNKALVEFVNEFDVMKTKINNLTKAFKKCQSTFSKDHLMITQLIELENNSIQWNQEITNNRNYINEHLYSLFQYINNEIKSFDKLIQTTNFAKQDYKATQKAEPNDKKHKNIYEYYKIMISEEYKHLILRQSNRVEDNIKLLKDKIISNKNQFT